LTIAVAWSLAGLVAVRPRCLRPCAIVSAAAVLALTAAAWLQTSHWRDSKTLWTHVVDCYPKNGLAYDYLGLAFLHNRQIDEAKAYYLKAFKLDRNDLEAASRLGNISAQQEKYAEAANYFRQASHLKPNHVGLLNNLALALAYCGKTDEAVEVFRKVFEIEPSAAARKNLDIAIAEQRKKERKSSAEERR
jgi:tetratricopeptide (TPR) repeat protein